MKKIQLTKGFVTLVDDEDFELLSQWEWSYKGGYACKRKQGKNIWMHRLIIETPQGMQTDHIDGDGLNNQRNNLRVCTWSQNQANRGKQKNNTSGYKGVCWDKREKKWRVTICSDGIRYHVGLFVSKTEAARAYNKKAQELHKDFANVILF